MNPDDRFQDDNPYAPPKSRDGDPASHDSPAKAPMQRRVSMSEAVIACVIVLLLGSPLFLVTCIGITILSAEFRILNSFWITEGVAFLGATALTLFVGRRLYRWLTV